MAQVVELDGMSKEEIAWRFSHLCKEAGGNSINKTLVALCRFGDKTVTLHPNIFSENDPFAEFAKDGVSDIDIDLRSPSKFIGHDGGMTITSDDDAVYIGNSGLEKKDVVDVDLE